MDDDEPIGMYERYYNSGTYASWRMFNRESNIHPKYHVIIAMAVVTISLGVMLLVAPMGMCYNAPLTAWKSACNFGGDLSATQGDDILLSTVNCNTMYDKKSWQTEPKIFYPHALKGRMYTALVIDPDAPNHKNGTYYLHMIQANIMGEDFIEGNFGKSMTIAPYVGPAPPKGSGDHRYMFVVYKHCKKIDKLPPMETPTRLKFDLQKWFKSLPFKMLGPEAGIQFRAHY